MQIPISISINEVKPEAIIVTYNGGFGIDRMIAGTLSFLKAKLPELTNVIVTKERHQLSIELSQLSQTKAIVENMRLRDIHVHDDHFEIKATLR